VKADGDLLYRERGLSAQTLRKGQFSRVLLMARHQIRFLPAQAAQFLSDDALAFRLCRLQAQLAIVVLPQEDVLPAVSAAYHMIHRARVLDAQLSRHVATLLVAAASCQVNWRPAGLTPFTNLASGEPPIARKGFFCSYYCTMKGNGISQAEGERANAPLRAQTKPTRRILVVEDDISLRRLNTQMLTCSGYEVDGAADGTIAWLALSTDSYDLLITAHDIPKLTGVELVRKARAARMTLPVVMATGTLRKAEFSRQPWLQPAALLPKPYTAEEMLRTVKRVLRES